MQRYCFLAFYLPDHSAAVAREPFNWLAHKLGVLASRNVIGVTMAPSHDPTSSVFSVVLTTEFPKQHVSASTASLVKGTLVTMERAVFDRSKDNEAPKPMETEIKAPSFPTAESEAMLAAVLKPILERMEAKRRLH